MLQLNIMIVTRRSLPTSQDVLQQSLKGVFFGLKDLSIYFESIFANGYFTFWDGGYITFQNNITYKITSPNASILFIGLRKLTSSKGISSKDRVAKCHGYERYMDI